MTFVLLPVDFSGLFFIEVAFPLLGDGSFAFCPLVMGKLDSSPLLLSLSAPIDLRLRLSPGQVMTLLK